MRAPLWWRRVFGGGPFPSEPKPRSARVPPQSAEDMRRRQEEMLRQQSATQQMSNLQASLQSAFGGAPNEPGPSFEQQMATKQYSGRPSAQVLAELLESNTKQRAEEIEVWEEQILKLQALIDDAYMTIEMNDGALAKYTPPPHQEEMFDDDVRTDAGAQSPGHDEGAEHGRDAPTEHPGGEVVTLPGTGRYDFAQVREPQEPVRQGGGGLPGGGGGVGEEVPDQQPPAARTQPEPER
jgi:hypothetical protein